jgi:hypothetical protein
MGGQAVEVLPVAVVYKKGNASGAAWLGSVVLSRQWTCRVVVNWSSSSGRKLPAHGLVTTTRLAS